MGEVDQSVVGPVIIAGMHRSGTSLTASMLESLGVDLGRELLQGDRHNARGYFEDRSFLEFQRHLLAQSCPPGDPGWTDWGWTEQERLDRASWPATKATAQSMIARRPSGRLWGWKDPRSALMLDYWAGLLPQARYVFVYRWPWDVADSILRIGHPTFVARPDYALRVWHYYNWHLLDFYRRNPGRCVLIRLDALVARPLEFQRLLGEKLGLSLVVSSPASGDQRFDANLLRALGLDHPLVASLSAAAPHHIDLLSELDASADLKGEPFQAPSDLQPERGCLALYYQVLEARNASSH